MHWIKRTAATVVIAAIGIAQQIGPALAGPDAEFFAGKTITYIVATKPGGGYDTYARLIAEFLERHLPVTKVLVKNLPGAGHIIGANKLYVAKPDGLTIGTFNTGLIYAQLIGREGVRFDLRDLGWIGAAARDARVVVLGSGSEFRTVADLRRAPGPILFGASGVG
ncbi:MAG: tripartite tricarboxylate transporter substrate-binding protein, partial [Gammaproteobacteria bacterium]|nr:tripartite tricarboxylate transporter substrate-binding protein [Gammaproteobacteria bacterium]